MRKFFLLLLLFLLNGCASDWPPKVLPGLEEISSYWQQPKQPIKMLGEMTLTLPDRQYSAEHDLLVNAEGQFRLNMYGPFAKRVLSVVCDGREVVALFYDENKAYTGQATPANLARLVGMELDPQRIYSLFSARAPFWLSKEELGLGQTLASSAAGEFLLLLPEQQSITMRLSDMRVLQASLRAEDKSMVEVLYRWRGQEDGLPLSMEIKSGNARSLNLYNDSNRYVEYNRSDFILPRIGQGMEIHFLGP